MNYQEKQEMKLERFQELAIKNKQQSENVYNAGKKISDAIPFGSPILVGHHSERHHRRDIERIHNSMRKSIELSEKSEYYENKVQNILNPRAISSDDENAIPKLKEKLVNLESQREKIKEFNKNARKQGTEALQSYVLTNLSQKINSVKKRIEYLKKQIKIEDSEEVIGDITIKIDKEDNRVRIIFPGKPEQEVINNLKRNGFRWSPYNKVWQRQISNYAIKLAKEIAGGNKLK